MDFATRVELEKPIRQLQGFALNEEENKAITSGGNGDYRSQVSC